jgi:hypothetical protein
LEISTFFEKNGKNHGFNQQITAERRKNRRSSSEFGGVENDEIMDFCIFTHFQTIKVGGAEILISALSTDNKIPRNVEFSTKFSTRKDCRTCQEKAPK